ncbi:hypothetical protein [Bartonella sp. DGB2]|uniref:hypothetical protein n=1 Tax=Bartonella sp. DGB2 TaxID=3388426 RepID=UPI00398FCE0F
MALDKGGLKKEVSILDTDNSSVLEEDLKSSIEHKMRLSKLDHQQCIEKEKIKIGKLGEFFGSWDNMPLFIALIAVVGGIFIFALLCFASFFVSKMSSY